MGLKGGKGQDFRCTPPFPIAKGGGFCIMGARGEACAAHSVSPWKKGWNDV